MNPTPWEGARIQQDYLLAACETIVLGFHTPRSAAAQAVTGKLIKETGKLIQEALIID
jgi:hypothetical protein